MNCPKCAGEMVQAQATNFGEKYHYCRACKKELKELESAEVPSWRRTGVSIGMDLAQAEPQRFVVVANSTYDDCDGVRPNDARERHVVRFARSSCRCGAMEMHPVKGWQKAELFGVVSSAPYRLIP